MEWLVYTLLWAQRQTSLLGSSLSLQGSATWHIDCLLYYVHWLVNFASVCNFENSLYQPSSCSAMRVLCEGALIREATGIFWAKVLSCPLEWALHMGVLTVVNMMPWRLSTNHQPCRAIYFLSVKTLVQASQVLKFLLTLKKALFDLQFMLMCPSWRGIPGVHVV